MAEALIKGMAGSARDWDIIVSEPVADRRAYLEKAYGVMATADNIEVVESSGIIVLAVKPQQMDEVIEGIKAAVTPDKTVVTIAAGIKLSYYEDRLNTTRIVRVMPNMGAFTQESMSVMSLCDCFTGKEINSVKEMLMASGRVLALPESHMDAVTAVSGSGPAFVALFADAMVKAGVSMGLREQDAMELVVQTFIGTSKLLDGQLRPEKLIEMVRSPGGTTAEGLKSFESDGFYDIVGKALKAAADRSAELARE
jgi:pyrroline-5-carboxylate reductase